MMNKIIIKIMKNTQKLLRNALILIRIIDQKLQKLRLNEKQKSFRKINFF